MSMPWWNEKKPGPSKPPASTPFSNTVRGSPKNPRIGCCLSNGLNGHGYADAPPAATSAMSTETRATWIERIVDPGTMGRGEDTGVSEAGAQSTSPPVTVAQAVCRRSRAPARGRPERRFEVDGSGREHSYSRANG